MYTGQYKENTWKQAEKHGYYAIQCTAEKIQKRYSTVHTRYPGLLQHNYLKRTQSLRFQLLSSWFYLYNTPSKRKNRLKFALISNNPIFYSKLSLKKPRRYTPLLASNRCQAIKSYSFITKSRLSLPHHTFLSL